MNQGIIISGGKEYGHNYVNAIVNSGGIPRYEYCPKYKEEYSGLILAGGYDMDPRYYNQKVNGSQNIDTCRDQAELKILDAFVMAKKPVLGICRGHQTINVYFGGDLIQHIEQSEVHQEENDAIHNTLTMRGSIIDLLYGGRVMTNSNHHQAIGILGEDLIATQHSDDGIIEAVEHKRLPIYGVQWHPERMCYAKAREGTIDASLLLRWFVHLCDIMSD